VTITEEAEWGKRLGEMQQVGSGMPRGTAFGQGKGKAKFKATRAVLQKRDKSHHFAPGWGVLAQQRVFWAWGGGSKKRRKKAHNPKEGDPPVCP